jgi:hypothetical protein
MTGRLIKDLDAALTALTVLTVRASARNLIHLNHEICSVLSLRSFSTNPEGALVSPSTF